MIDTGTSTEITLVSVMITPAILILASGSLVASTLTRLGRIVDRARMLIAHVTSARSAGDTMTVDLYMKWLANYQRRSFFVERALTAYYTAIGFFVAASLTLALDNLLRTRLPWIAVTLTVVGVLLVFAGTVALVLETNLATGILRDEIALIEGNVLPPDRL